MKCSSAHGAGTGRGEPRDTKGQGPGPFRVSRRQAFPASLLRFFEVLLITQLTLLTRQNRFKEMQPSLISLNSEQLETEVCCLCVGFKQLPTDQVCSAIWKYTLNVQTKKRQTDTPRITKNSFKSTLTKI